MRDGEGSRRSGHMQCTNRFSCNLQPSRADGSCVGRPAGEPVPV